MLAAHDADLLESCDPSPGADSQTRVAAHLFSVRQAMIHALRAQAGAGPLLPDPARTLAYLQAELAHAPAEEVRILYLNNAFRLLKEVRIAAGGVSSASIRPREVIRGALDIAAVGLILVHNHPSGDPTPSEGDRKVTDEIRAAARLFDLTLVDHFIIASSGWVSFKAEGLL